MVEASLYYRIEWDDSNQIWKVLCGRIDTSLGRNHPRILVNGKKRFIADFSTSVEDAWKDAFVRMLRKLRAQECTYDMDKAVPVVNKKVCELNRLKRKLQKHGIWKSDGK